jgi:hypothetical protein
LSAARCSGDFPPWARHSLPAAKLCYGGNGSDEKKPVSSMADVPDEVPISHLQRRRIESRVLIPFIEACREKFGDAATRELVVATIRRLAAEDGARWGAAFGRDLGALKTVAEEVWAGGGSLDIEIVAAGENHLDFNVTRCRYAEFYKELGLPDLGYLVHCNRDHAMIDGFNPDLQLTRTQTVMEGASHCDFRFAKKTDKQTNKNT